MLLLLFVVVVFVVLVMFELKYCRIILVGLWW
jgi:hypothetical protein